MDIETRILVAIKHKPLSMTELVDAVEFSGEELGQALYDLKAKFLVEKHPVISGSCKACACMKTYVYRLTFAGRKLLEEQAL
jgi:hypothetical protein